MIMLMGGSKHNSNQTYGWARQILRPFPELEDLGRIAGRAAPKRCEQFQQARKEVGSTRETFPTIKVYRYLKSDDGQCLYFIIKYLLCPM